MSPSVANCSFMSASRHSKSKAEGMLSHRFLANYEFHLFNVGPKCCSSTTIFPSTWECDQGFSASMAIESKSRNHLSGPGHDFRCAASKVMP